MRNGWKRIMNIWKITRYWRSLFQELTIVVYRALRRWISNDKSIGAYSLTSKWSPGGMFLSNKVFWRLVYLQEQEERQFIFDWIGFGNPSDNSYITLADQYHLQLWKVVKPWSICHSGSIGEQLYYGIRAFDIRAMWDGEWYSSLDLFEYWLFVGIFTIIWEECLWEMYCMIFITL